MVRGLLRFIGFWFLAAALIAAVLDGARSIAMSHLVYTPVAEAWATLFPDSLAELGRLVVTDLGQPWLWTLATTWLLGAPVAVGLGLIGFLLVVAGRKRRPDILARQYAL
jgi:hypothetical protein